MRAWTFALLTGIVLSGCATSRSPCDYDPRKENWSPLSAPLPATLQPLWDENERWFTNEAGDVLSCPKKPWYAISSTCGSVYEIYKKKAGGTYEEPQLIVCMT